MLFPPLASLFLSNFLHLELPLAETGLLGSAFAKEDSSVQLNLNSFIEERGCEYCCWW